MFNYLNYFKTLRAFIKSCVNAGVDDNLIFCGHGCTGAVHKLINGLNLTEAPVIMFINLELKDI
jgi:selenocysteine lyase/cysteine desulfurase